MTLSMGRVVVTTFIAVLVGSLGAAGCGSESDPTGLLDPAQPISAGGPVAVEPTGGRLGDATVVRDGSELRELSPGGRLDTRRRGGASQRDGVGAGAACANPDLAPAPDTLPAVAEATLCLLNGERADNGLAPLTPNATLAGVGTAYAQDMVAGSYFSHTGRDGSGVFERIERSGYLPDGAGWVLGENLAWGTGGLATPGSIMRAWMNSPGHRANILNPDYREIGVGVVAGNPAQPDGLGATYATEFGAIEGVQEAFGDPVPVADARRDAPRARKNRKRARRHARARNARHTRRGGKRHARIQRRGKVGRVTARIAI
jgi:uncharacterized protein YkwD